MENTPTKSSPVMPQLIILTLFWVGLQLVATWVKDDFSHVSQYISEMLTSVRHWHLVI